MKRKFNITLIMLLIMQYIFIIFSPATKILANSHYDEVRLALDALNKFELPSKFRKTTDTIIVPKGEVINLKGLDTLNISGSKQFSQDSLIVIKKIIDDRKVPMKVIDLREEFHGFINGIAVSWENIGNNANANSNLTIGELLAKEEDLLNSIILYQPITIYSSPSITVVPGVVWNELTLCEEFNLDYYRIPVTDGKLPKSNMVDYFIDQVRDLNSSNWIHFHCKEGIGRTTTFMIMYDMMINAKLVSSNDIIQRQLLLAKFNDAEMKSFSTNERINFLNKFYDYCKANNDNFQTSWSQWIIKHSNAA